jgi:DNA-binding winged helix-turn-helix (wHTH) protein
MHVCRIRRKLRAAGASSLEVETIYGRGYALRLRDPAAQSARSPGDGDSANVERANQ